MSKQPENEMQAELEVTKQAIEELSDEELESITGGSLSNRIHNAGSYAKGTYQLMRGAGSGKVESASYGALASVIGLSKGDQKVSSQEVRLEYGARHFQGVSEAEASMGSQPATLPVGTLSAAPRP
jgi:bacteriocin-like protein